MRIPCVSIVIPASTSPVVRAPAYMAPIYLEIWRARLASEGKTSVDILPINPPEYREIDSIQAEKDDLTNRFGRSQGSGAVVFDKVYPGDTFERAVDRIMLDEAARELAVNVPVTRPFDADVLAVVADTLLSEEIYALGLHTVEDVANAPVSKLCEIRGITPGQASKLHDRFAAALEDDLKAKAEAAKAKPLEEKSAKK